MSEASNDFLRSLAIHVTCGSLGPPMQLSALPCSVHPGESDLIPGRIAFFVHSALLALFFFLCRDPRQH